MTLNVKIFRTLLLFTELRYCSHKFGKALDEKAALKKNIVLVTFLLL